MRLVSMRASVGALANRGGGPNTLPSSAPLKEGWYLFMKRILLLVTLALMLAAALALSGVAQARPIADSADAKCAKLAIKTLGPSFNPSNYTFIGGTEGEDFDAFFTGQA